jgi:serine/threonine protein kinase
MNDQGGQHQGKQFGSYRLTKLLGEGGFAEVYLGEHVRTGIQAAVKVLATKLVDDEIALFRREAQTMIGLDHPNIIQIYDYGMEGHIPFIVMVYASNGSLRQIHRKGTRIPLPTIINYAKPIADGLQYMHNKRLIHRDLKPENILLGINGKLLLSDFGIAAIAHSTNSLQTQGQSGTIHYMAPEQLQGKPRIASDQYALGIIIYEWICGRHPFTGTYTEIATQHLLTPPEPLHTYVPDISPNVEQVVMKALDKDPYKRFTSVVELAQALEHAYQATSISLHKPDQAYPSPHPYPNPDTTFLEKKGNAIAIHKPAAIVDSTTTSTASPAHVQVPISIPKVPQVAHKKLHSQTPRRRIIALSSSFILFILLIGILAYFVPSAEITITLPAQNYSATVKLVAGPGSQANVAAGIGVVQEITFKKDFTTSGTGNATGTTKIGTAWAHGTVIFTNNSNQQITIPSGVLLSTSNGTQFTTEDNVALGPTNSTFNGVPSSIDAQVSGDSGNVPAGSITIIPPGTMKLIEQANSTVSASAINLQVTNDEPTTGGGVGSAISITQKDLDTTQSALSSQLQNSVNAWVQQQLSTGDVAGKPVITPTLTSAPKVDTIVAQGNTFSATLKENVEVAVVRSAVLQSATIMQLNRILKNSKNYQNYEIASNSPQPVQIPQFTPISNGLSMTLSFIPIGKIIQKLSSDTLKSQIRGKTANDAEATLKRLTPATSVTVKISPSFFPLISLAMDHINLKFVA